MTPEKVQLIAAAVLPAIVILALLAVRLRPLRLGRPWMPLAIAFGAGALASVPAVYVEGFLTHHPWKFSNFGILFIFAMVVAGLVEETCKMAAFYCGPARTRWFQEEYDGILFSATVALGFATVENIYYVLDGGLTTAMMRAYTAVPLHAACGIIMGACIGAARVRQQFKWSDMGLPLTGLLLAITVHGLYDVLAFHDASNLSHMMLYAMMAGLLVWCVRRIIQARRRSPSFGGRALPLPPPVYAGPLRLPTRINGRNPWLAGALGLIPGLGQFYNGERTKAMVFFLIGSVNLALYYIVHFFVHAPGTAVQWLIWLGLAPTVAITPAQLQAAVEQRWLLEPVLLSLVLMWELAGMVDAYVTAQVQAVRPQVYAVRRSLASHGFGSSYVVHLIVVFMLVFAPIMLEASGGGKSGNNGKEAGGAAGGGGQEGQGDVGGISVTWVGAPIKIEGWNPHAPEGDPKDSGTARVGARPMVKAEKGPGMVKVEPGTPAPPPKGEKKSYNEYLSSQIRSNDGDSYYFKRVTPGTWSVVRYVIGTHGDLISADLIKTSGSDAEGMRAVKVVENAAPYAPLPGGVDSIEVIELFWSQDHAVFDPGTMEERLSRLPDGREISVAGSPTQDE